MVIEPQLLLLGGIIAVIIAWKFIKFAIKILLVIVVIFIIIMGLDFFKVFDAIQAFLGNLV